MCLYMYTYLEIEKREDLFSYHHTVNKNQSEKQFFKKLSVILEVYVTSSGSIKK